MPNTVAAVLINPNQLRTHGKEVQDNPGTMFVKDTDEYVMIPMYAEGTNICIKTRTPTKVKLVSCNHIHLTSDREWEPNDIKYPEIAAVHRDVDVFRRDYGEDFAPGECTMSIASVDDSLQVVESLTLELLRWYVVCMHRRHSKRRRGGQV
jgi:hypothetical protein